MPINRSILPAQLCKREENKTKDETCVTRLRVYIFIFHSNVVVVPASRTTFQIFWIRANNTFPDFLETCKQGIPRFSGELQTIHSHIFWVRTNNLRFSGDVQTTHSQIFWNRANCKQHLPRFSMHVKTPKSPDSLLHLCT
jgi:hypothetical protein